jgi:CheY-like chemotaxis protein
MVPTLIPIARLYSLFQARAGSIADYLLKRIKVSLSHEAGNIIMGRFVYVPEVVLVLLTGGVPSPRHRVGAKRQLLVGKQILIIDDQSQLLSLMRRILEDEQYQVSILQNGKDAFTQMKALLPDLLILDLKLGNVSGQDVLRQLKKDAVTAEIPVIVYTAAVLEAEEVATMISSDPILYQRVHLVHKPFELEDLLTLVGQVLNEPVS